ncbi:hypothetical protein COY93_01765 [Candidatus Uhrbacteria bacterium CG_4_10_14_0_8_um_filter_58_22]|uniref:DUF4145 domain-containing protein n=1 Tax=Candidatus Uhrbacteria bacterium CG_4_10_14_0_8_um_filter_58_22 TaxID=1975029 RepID=A0A2M7QAF0_9BACT|nr:MAG: hypothetical protein AUJ19_04425 [Parcubacteria group bacterium CG1_02_58_44]PIY62918.1 MAG: hypothetical protein COY93_01765 [Candidatus Uhrbacteria bacterium CG_4_10_14_0_8_um_filter_58_22]
MTVTFDVLALGEGIGVAAVVVLTLVMLWLMFANLRHWLASRKYEIGDRSAMQRRWQEVESLLDAPGELSPKLALIEADKLLDHALKTLAMPGETLGERLKFAQYKYPHLRDVWWAHGIRNRLVHEASYRLDRHLARKAIHQFRKSLQSIGAI